MNPFDAGIIHFFNQFAYRSLTLDAIAGLAGSNNLIKGGAMMSLLIWMWFREGSEDERDHRREVLLSGLFFSIAALFVCRLLAFALPFRERPLREVGLSFQLPYGMDADSLIHWSSFPSDHAVLFFGLAMTVFFVSRRAGWWALGYAVIVICLPRIYLGIHYPTDILAGALLGTAAATLSQVSVIRRPLMKNFLLWSKKSPKSFYAFLFFLTSETADLFDPIRAILSAAVQEPRVFLLLLGGVVFAAVIAWRVLFRKLAAPIS
ncbi:MAG TPA: phosphatase PAP2 family protein [Burkholderiaceae bacterium]|jgi:undecaprenyl-diphosphatase|nr:phosphatase PAP2 family protein [Burkholderiaceae bacterium]